MSSTLEERLLEHIRVHRDDGILLDTNVLLLLLIAQVYPDRIGSKRLEKYTLEDAQLLSGFVQKFNRILTTAHILAETSNLAAQALTGRLKEEFFLKLFPLFASNQPVALHQCPIEVESVDQRIFVHLGLTDASIVAAVDVNRLLLTDDFDLYMAASSKGAPAINFNHMREAAGLV